jgi:hypothetical protein
MRAVVIEIHKHYCIAATPDGRFVKQHAEQGELEIGDEIMLEAGYPVPSRDWIKTLAIALAALAVIGFGSWGMFKVFGWYSPVAGSMDESAEADFEVREEAMTMIAEEEAVEQGVAEAAEEAPAAAEESEDYAFEMKQVEDIPAGPGKVDADFYLDLGVMGEPVEVIAGNLLFLYWVAESEQGLEVFFNIEELDPELAFTGYVELIILDAEGAVTGARSFDFEEFKRGERLQEVITIQEADAAMNILINGIFE